MDAFIITMALSARAIQHGAHRHDRRGIYRCVLLRFRGRIEIDHSYGLRWSGLCCHSRHSTRGPAGAAASGRATAGPLVLCREWQHKPLQRRPYRGQFLYPTVRRVWHGLPWTAMWRLWVRDDVTIVAIDFEWKNVTQTKQRRDMRLTSWLTLRLNRLDLDPDRVRLGPGPSQVLSQVSSQDC